MRIALHAIGRSGGSRLKIDNLPVIDCPIEASLEKLKAAGFDEYVEANTGIMGMAADALRDTLNQTKIPPDHIDALFVATTSHWEIDPAITEGRITSYSADAKPLIHCAVQAGLTNAYPYSAVLSGCANIITAMRLALPLIKSEIHKNIAVVSSDRIEPIDSRIMKNDVAVYSDIAASFVISTDYPEFFINHLVTHACLPLLCDGGEGPGPSAGLFVRFINEFDTKLKNSGISMQDYQIVVMDNFNSDVVGFVCYLLSIDTSKIRLASKATDGHAFSVDWVLSLAALKRAGELPPGSKVAVINLGATVLGFVELETAR